MRGYITEIDFEECDEEFPGIVHYYRELKDKPRTFLELLWAYTHRACARPEPCAVATRPASRSVSR
jgi:hypothetical protein